MTGEDMVMVSKSLWQISTKFLQIPSNRIFGYFTENDPTHLKYYTFKRIRLFVTLCQVSRTAVKYREGNFNMSEKGTVTKRGNGHNLCYQRQNYIKIKVQNKYQNNNVIRSDEI